VLSLGRRAEASSSDGEGTTLLLEPEKLYVLELEKLGTELWTEIYPEARELEAAISPPPPLSVNIPVVISFITLFALGGFDREYS
jgi:hypothetical protein